MKSKSPYFLLLFLVFSTFLFSCNKISTPDGATISDITINSIRPIHGPYDTIDTLFGKGFDKIPVLDSVLLNGKKLTLISKSPEQVIVKIPKMAGTGNIDIWYQGKLISGPVFTYDSTLFVTTLAGSSTDSGAVDGQGLNARFNQPHGIAVDQSGNIYVADMNNNSIRKITAQGNVTTLAGPLSGVRDYVDGTGSAARFSAPFGLAIGPDGFLYVGDQFNYRVRKVSLSGVVSTFAGIGWNSGLLAGGIDGDISVATFDAPFGVCVDRYNNVYVADLYNNKIRKITSTGIVSTYAGGDYYHFGLQDGPAATSLFFNPLVVAVDIYGNVFVGDNENHLLRKISPGGTVTTLLGPLEPSLTGTTEVFHTSALAADKAGNLFFSIRYGIVKMTPDGNIIRYALGGVGEVDGPAQIATYRAIGGIAVDDSDNLYITDNNRVRKISWQ